MVYLCATAYIFYDAGRTLYKGVNIDKEENEMGRILKAMVVAYVFKKLKNRVMRKSYRT